ncbi:MAG TPA: cyclodeaminase/cyclohydrolase family protein [Vicinamibacterales bacterium]|nr:cyclodeaminase/cyclohydrolase family protein [Vicinamibacterales bacterium]
MLAKKSLTEVLDAFSSSDPTPGGGSAAALAGALGASLLAMVAGLPRTKTNAPEERAALDTARAKILDLRTRLIDLIDRDAAAYDTVVAAYRLPKATDDEKAARKTAIQDALKLATEIPVETCLAVNDVVRQADAVAASGNPSAGSDIAVALQLLGIAGQGALFNVEANIGSVTDKEFAAGITGRVKQSYAGTSEAIRGAYESAGVIELMKGMAARFGSLHGQARGGEKPPADVLIRSAVEALRIAGSADARRALEALAQSADEKISRPAADALAKLTAPD